MIEVILYSRQDCHLCEVAHQDLQELQTIVPHQLKVVDVDSSPDLRKQYGFEVPVIVVGPYTMRAPIDRKDLEITLRSAEYRLGQIQQIDDAIESGKIDLELSWTGSDRFSHWLSRHYLAVLNIMVLIYLGLPFLAPAMMEVGWTTPAGWIYRGYGMVCHQLAFRSYFIFGEQTIYPRSLAGIPGAVSYEDATGLNGSDLLTARNFTGNPELGFKVALCERDVAIYVGIFLFGLIYAVVRQRLPSMPWYIWLLLAIVPMGVDGFSQMISQLFSALPDRESTPLLRVLTGFAFGFFTCWFFYPMVEQSMRETEDYLTVKLRRFLKQQERRQPHSNPIS